MSFLKTALCIALCLTWYTGVVDAHPERGMVASVHPLATEAGVNTLKSGGNAVDAAVAVGLTLGVVDTSNSEIGGGCFILIRRADGSLVAIDGRETAPAAATRNMFAGKSSQTGALASGVPGALAAYEFAVEHYGRKKLKDLILPAAEIAERGFRINKDYASKLKLVGTNLARFDSSRAIFFKKGESLQKGDILRQPDLGATYRHIAEQGSGWFYRGPFAQAVEEWMKGYGGMMTAEDLRNYRVVLREPILSSWESSRQATNGITGNPMFVDAGKGPFWLRAESPARGKGAAAHAPETDFWGRSRPKNQLVDQGAISFIPELAKSAARQRFEFGWAYYRHGSGGTIPDLWLLPSSTP